MLQKIFEDVTRKVDDALDKLIPSEEAQPAKLYKAIRQKIFEDVTAFLRAENAFVPRSFSPPEKFSKHRKKNFFAPRRQSR